MSTLSDALDRLTAPAQLVEAMEETGMPGCVACGHRRRIRSGRRGICEVRFNRAGGPRVPSGYVATAQVDPIEKKPYSHVYVGSRVLTFGILGCDLHCGYCQNWITSETLRDPEAGGTEFIQLVSPQ